MNAKKENHYMQEDEIDLKELFETLYQYKLFIIIFTLTITLLSAVYVYMKTPVYEVKSNVQIGFIGDKLVDDSDEIVKKLNIIFNVEDKPNTKNKFTSEVLSITSNKKLKNFIEIKTEAITNNDALQKNKAVVSYLQKEYEPKIKQYIFNTKNQIHDIEQKINNIDNFETKNIQRQIELLKAQTIAKIDEKIKLLKEQDIKKLQRQINLLKTQDIVKFDEKIKFYNNIKIPALNAKINFHTKNLKKYTEAVNNLYKNNNNTKNSAIATISSIQMVNYQNLILNSQNKLEDLKLEIEKIYNETIPNLQREKDNIQTVTIKDLQQKIDNINKIVIVNLQRKKDNILNVTIKDLQQKIDNINKIAIINLQREKNNIQNDSIRKLQHKLTVDLPNRKMKLQEQIEQLKFNMSMQNVQNSHIVGHYIIHDYPVKPKKKLIIIVAFITGFILSVFLVLLYTFIRKEEVSH
jgi:LPS O-antigen subunit length determinant protein (WzzB/FepE family)